MKWNPEIKRWETVVTAPGLVIQVVQLRNRGELQKNIAVEVGIPQQRVSKIIRKHQLSLPPGTSTVMDAQTQEKEKLLIPVDSRAHQCDGGAMVIKP